MVHHEIRIGPWPLRAILAVPAQARGLVIFAHGSGSGRLSPRNMYVASCLQQHGLATLLLDLLTRHEEGDRRNVFDIDLLAGRLRFVVDWAQGMARLRHLRPCYFGASTGAGAALSAASDDPRIAAVVSRGGRPDLAGEEALRLVRAPTLLIVGGSDEAVLALNRAALDFMQCERQLQVIPGASHLFEEEGALDEVARLAGAWLRHHSGEEE